MANVRLYSGVGLFVFGLLIFTNIVPLSSIPLNTSATINNPVVSCVGASNIKCSVSYTFSNLNANCSGTFGCEQFIQVWACRTLFTNPSMLYCQNAYAQVPAVTTFQLVSLANWQKVTQPIAGSSVGVSQSFTFSSYPIYYIDIHALDASFNLIADWNNFNTGLVPTVSGSGYNLIMQPTGYESNGCTTTPAKGTSTASGSVTLSAVGSCTVNSGTATFSQWAFYSGSISNGQETWTLTGTSTSNPTTYTVSADTEVFPSYSCTNACNIVNPTFNVLTAPGTGVTISPTSAALTTASPSITFTISPQTGFTLSGWMGWQITGCSALSPITGTSTSFTLTYSQLQSCIGVGSLNTLFYVNTASALNNGVLLVIAGNSGGQTNPAYGSYPEVAGSSVTITETPASGYQFAGWTVTQNGNSVSQGTASSLTLTMPSASLGVPQTVFVGAAFTLIPPASGSNLFIACGTGWTTNPTCGTLIPENGPYPQNAIVTVIPAPGYTFCGWVVDGQPADSAGNEYLANPIDIQFTGPNQYHGIAPTIVTTSLGCGGISPPPFGGGGGGITGQIIGIASMVGGFALVVSGLGKRRR